MPPRRRGLLRCAGLFCAARGLVRCARGSLSSRLVSLSSPPPPQIALRRAAAAAAADDDDDDDDDDDADDDDAFAAAAARPLRARTRARHKKKRRRLVSVESIQVGARARVGQGRARAFDAAGETMLTAASEASPTASPAAAPPHEEDRACRRREEEHGGTWRATRARHRVNGQGGAPSMQRRQRRSERARAEFRGPTQQKSHAIDTFQAAVLDEDQRHSCLAVATPANTQGLVCLRESREGVEG